MSINNVKLESIKMASWTLYADPDGIYKRDSCGK